MNKKILTIIISVLALIGFALLGFQLQNWLLGSANVSRAQIDENCDLHQTPCTSTFDNGSTATLTITPNSIPLLQPLRFEIKLEGIKASSIHMNLIGLNMNMGINQTTLATTDNIYFGGGMPLPICSIKRMEWEAQAKITTLDNKVLLAPFHFYTTR